MLQKEPRRLQDPTHKKFYTKSCQKTISLTMFATETFPLFYNTLSVSELEKHGDYIPATKGIRASYDRVSGTFSIANKVQCNERGNFDQFNLLKFLSSGVKVVVAKYRPCNGSGFVAGSAVFISIYFYMENSMKETKSVVTISKSLYHKSGYYIDR